MRSVQEAGPNFPLDVGEEAAPRGDCQCRSLSSRTMSASGSVPKRRRVDRSPSPTYKLDDENDNYEPYVPVAKRREAKLAALRGIDERRRADGTSQEPEDVGSDDEEERKKEKERTERTLLVEAQEVHRKKAAEGLYKSTKLHAYIADSGTTSDAQKTTAEKNEEADAAILAAIASRKKLASDLELAKGIQYTEPLKSSYVPFI